MITLTRPIYEAILHAVWAFERLNEASTMSQQAAAYRALQDAMSDLAAYHPDYDYKVGEILPNPIERLAIDLDEDMFSDQRRVRQPPASFYTLPHTLSPRCGCKLLCGDKPETSDHPYAVCKSLPMSNDALLEDQQAFVDRDEATSEGLARSLTPEVEG